MVADRQCPKIRQLLSQALVPVLWLDGEREPLQVITDALAHRRKQGLPVQTLHWVSHGSPGRLHLGTTRITGNTLLTNAQGLASWGLSTLALWSCQAGADRAFIAVGRTDRRQRVEQQ